MPGVPLSGTTVNDRGGAKLHGVGTRYDRGRRNRGKSAEGGYILLPDGRLLRHLYYRLQRDACCATRSKKRVGGQRAGFTGGCARSSHPFCTIPSHSSWFTQQNTPLDNHLKRNQSRRILAKKHFVNRTL